MISQVDHSTPIIEVANLYRSFGTVHAVRGITFNIYPGQVVGFIGANGAGKTTTMRMMATLELPTFGRISICGYDVVAYPNEVRRRVGWMPDSYGTYDNMTVEEYLDFYARAYGFRGEERERRVREVMEFTDLVSIRERLMDKLSKGMGQRLCLGRTLLHDPAVLILDEPAAGLDPKARIELKNLIRLLAEEGKTIFISSHILSELGEMCDTLLFIDSGRLVHHGSQESLLRHQGTTADIDVLVSSSPQALLDWVDCNPGVELVSEIRRGARVRIELPQMKEEEVIYDSEGNPQSALTAPGLLPDPEENDRAYLAYILRKMVQEGVEVVDFHRQERKLEDAFVDMLSRVNQAKAQAQTAAQLPAGPASGIPASAPAPRP